MVYSKSKDADVAKQSAEYDRLQKQLQQKLLQVEEELAMEKQKMLVEKEDSLRTQAQEHRVKVHNTNTTCTLLSGIIALLFMYIHAIPCIVYTCACYSKSK